MCMINKISVDEITSPNSITSRHNKEGKQQAPNFKGVGGFLLTGIQTCEKMPMINVAVIDMLSAILPRTVVESMTNWFAGFEAFRRESSGLVVNCMIPGFITLGIAKCLNPMFMPKGADMSHCWGDSKLIGKAESYYSNAISEDKIEEVLSKTIGNIEGFHGKEHVKFEEVLGKDKVKEYAKALAEISREKTKGWKSRKNADKKVVNIAKEIVAKTHVSENIKVENVKASNVESLLSDMVKFLRGYQNSGDMSISEFAKKSKKLIRTKSLLGLTVVLPLAASMQYINRWITGKVSGTKGAPIYEDFAKGKENIEENPKAKQGLLKQKLISISSMIGVGILAMMKIPTLNVLEFKGIFPTMDQARIISTTTFASRMAAADDKNELAESTIRDIATFCGLYFFGDYAAKGMATYLQKKTGISLLNETKKLKDNANTFDKFIHWVKDINIKSSDEVVGKTDKELKRAVNLRSACQVTNIGVSLILLGIIIPIFTRRNTKRKHEQALKLAQENDSLKSQEQKEPAVTPLNVDYTKLTSGFRSKNNK